MAMDYMIGAIVGDSYVFPEVQSTRDNRTKYWKIMVRLVGADGAPLGLDEAFFNDAARLPEGAKAHIIVESRVGQGGKIRATVPTVIDRGVNEGKANATNAFTQALREAHSKYKKKLQKSSSNETEEYAGVKLWPPMLASPLDDIAIDFRAPVWIQPKANGVRAVAVLGPQGVIIYSRARHLYVGLGHIKGALEAPLRALLENNGLRIYLDGELYLHGETLETISGIARRELNVEAVKTKLKYYVFDSFIPEAPDMPFMVRDDYLDGVFERLGPNEFVVRMPTFPIKSMEDAMEYYETFIEEGYEGAMLRLNRPYVFSFDAYHSTNILKIKPLFDDEFEIVGYKEGQKGKAKGALMFILRTKGGLDFPVSPNVPDDERKALYRRMGEIGEGGLSVFEREYKGRLMNIQYEGLTKNGIPTNIKTNGIVIRDYE